MQKLKIFFSHGFGRVIKWVFWILVAAYVALVFFRAFQMIEEDKTKAQIEKIHTTKLELVDVMGKNLPPDPGETADDTIEGVDVNINGIRDDVERAIFEKYPNSPKTRAPLLQYAMALQMETTQPFLNTGVSDGVIGKQDRGYVCIADTLVPRKNDESGRSREEVDKIDNYIKYIETLQLNTLGRQQQHDDVYELMDNFALSGEKVNCDLSI